MTFIENCSQCNVPEEFTMVLTKLYKELSTEYSIQIDSCILHFNRTNHIGRYSIYETITPDHENILDLNIFMAKYEESRNIYTTHTIKCLKSLLMDTLYFLDKIKFS